MHVDSITIPYKGCVDFIILSDLHYGAESCDIDSFQKVVKNYLDGRYWFVLGDMLDSIIYSDRRFDYKSCRINDIIHLANDLIDMLKPYSDKCLGYITGNHEEALRKKTQIDVSQYIAEQLGVPYFGYSAYLLMRFHRVNHSELWRFFLSHGSYSGSTRCGKIRKIESLSDIYDADIYITGHMHDLVYTEDFCYTLDNKGNLKEKKRYYIISGGYLKPFDNYVEHKLMKPTRIGSPLLRIHPEKREVNIEFIP